MPWMMQHLIGFGLQSAGVMLHERRMLQVSMQLHLLKRPWSASICHIVWRNKLKLLGPMSIQAALKKLLQCRTLTSSLVV